jgi:hypothetical protein
MLPPFFFYPPGGFHPETGHPLDRALKILFAMCKETLTSSESTYMKRRYRPVLV